MSYILFYFLLVNSGQFMQFHVTCCLQTRLLTNNMARKSITYWHCCCKPRPLFMRLVNLTYQLLHYIYIHFWTGFFLAMFSVSETPEDAIHFFEGAVTRMPILGSHVTDQIPSPKFRSRLYRRSLTEWCCFSWMFVTRLRTRKILKRLERIWLRGNFKVDW